jgi:hypothetical protein
VGKMNRKIIIRAEDFNKEILSFLAEVGADMPIDWDNEGLCRVRNAVIEAYEKMGVILEIDERRNKPAHTVTFLPMFKPPCS